LSCGTAYVLESGPCWIESVIGEQCRLTVPASATQLYIMVHGCGASTYSIGASYMAP
jgi:hypothetical protein